MYTIFIEFDSVEEAMENIEECSLKSIVYDRDTPFLCETFDEAQSKVLELNRMFSDRSAGRYEIYHLLHCAS